MHYHLDYSFSLVGHKLGNFSDTFSTLLHRQKHSALYKRSKWSSGQTQMATNIPLNSCLLLPASLYTGLQLFLGGGGGGTNPEHPVKIYFIFWEGEWADPEHPVKKWIKISEHPVGMLFGILSSSNSYSSCSSCSSYSNSSCSCSPFSSCSCSSPSFCFCSCSLLSYLLIATLVQREFLLCFNLIFLL